MVKIDTEYDYIIVGAGSVVTKNTENNVTLVGNPCKILQKKKM